MWRLNGPEFHCCDGVRRRSFLQAGVLGLSGLTLSDFLRVTAQAETDSAKPQRRAIIYIELAGGPSHFETYDPKPQAPVEYRGALTAIDTKVAGVHFSQYMERQAGIADKLAVVRSIHHESSSHQTSAHLVQTGYYLRDRQNRENEMPCTGAIVSQCLHEKAVGVPPFVAVPTAMRYGKSAFLGTGCGPFETGGDPNKDKFQVLNLVRNGALDVERLEGRRSLLAAFDAQRRVVDTHGLSDSLDTFSQQAYDIVTSPLAQRAFDLKREKDKVRNRYGRSTVGQSLLLARRLVEAGVPFVSVRSGGWDDHTNLVKRLSARAPAYDQGLAALVEDIYGRDLDRDVLVVAMGEFGRTPRVNKNAGRDHWGAVMSVLLSGGGLRVGQVVGSSSVKGDVPTEAPYRPEDVLATMYRHLGIDSQQTFNDFAGRPRYVLERGTPIAELT
jgi:uncharacterized protein (DUF1501 family)